MARALQCTRSMSAFRSHLASLTIYAALLLIAAGLHSSHPVGAWPLGLAAGVLLYFQAFALAHDAMHGALGLSRRCNAWVLSAAASLLLTQGHAMRVLHMVHHQHPLGKDDVEGRPARYSFRKAALLAPVSALTYCSKAYALAPTGVRSTIRGELVSSLITCVALILIRSPIAHMYFALAIGLQLFMGLWASKIPHDPLLWLYRAAERLSRLHSPIVASLLWHKLQHRHPRVPCRDLGALDRRVHGVVQ